MANQPTALKGVMSPDSPHTENKTNAGDTLTGLPKQILDALDCGVFAYTIPDYQVLTLNDTMKQIYGLEQAGDGSFGTVMMEFVLPEDMPVVRAAAAKLQKPGDSESYVYRIRKNERQICTLKSHTSRQLQDNGKEYILSVVQDITAQEELRVSLDREKQLYRNALTHGVDCCFTFDVTTGMITEPVTVRGIDILYILGLSLPVHYDTFSTRFFEYYNVQISDPRMMECYSCDGLKRMYQNNCLSMEAECYMARADVYYSALVILSKDKQNGHLYALYFSSDTTDQHIREEARRQELEEAREELALSNAELQEALHSEQQKIRVIGAISNVFIVIFHVDLKTGTYREVSDRHFFDDVYRRYPHVSDGFPLLITKKVAPQFQQRVSEFLDFSTLDERMGSGNTLHLEYLTSEDTWVRSSIIEAKRDPDGTLSEILFATDLIDDVKRKELMQREALKDAYEAANRANEAKTVFLSSMSHDIRTPMNAIIGMTAIAGAHIDDRERVTDCLAKITASSKHLLGLINEVLDMNKIESGKLDLCVEEFNLSDLVDNVLMMVRPQVDARGHELIVNILNVEHERVAGDSQRIQQVFMNLMSNAIKYTPEGGRIELSIRETPTNHRQIGCFEFVFQDNGIGMSEEFVPHIFEAFSRAKDSVVEKMQGTGLGMAITNNIVRMMNGDIKVESRLGAGSKFTVTMYLEVLDVKEPEELEPFVDLPVLMVDDDTSACEAACTILQELGMDGEWVLSGREAVTLVEQRHQDGKDFFAVIIDWKMPDMDGIATTKEIRRRVGEDVPIIIISAYDWSEIEMEARAACANAFLSKPIFKSRVIHLFKSLLGNETEAEQGFDISQFSREDFSGSRALLVEDNAINAEIAQEILGMTGLTVELAVNGKEAVRRFEEVEDGYYDVIFMDIQMPVMNGYEATRAIRAMSRKYAKRVPILAMTANAFAEDVQESKNAGMNEHIAKPMNFEELLRALNRWLR